MDWNLLTILSCVIGSAEGALPDEAILGLGRLVWRVSTATGDGDRDGDGNEENEENEDSLPRLPPPLLVTTSPRHPRVLVLAVRHGVT